MVTTLTRQPDPATKFYRPRGAAKALFPCRSTEVLIEGPAGTGKTVAVLEKINRWLLKCPNSRALIVRKTRISMTQSVLVTLEKKVIPANPELYPDLQNMQRRTRQSYMYPNGSELVVGGLDDPDRIMSTEYDLIGEFEATELTQDDHEKLATRLRNYAMPFQQIIADCNPGSPAHWLNLRGKGSQMVRLLSRHIDNPLFYDEDGSITKAGRDYMAILGNSLTGSRKLRLLDGKWAKAEGLVYEEFDSAIHVIPSVDHSIFRRYVAGVDWGFTEPGAIELFGVDGDSRMYRVREVYRSRKTIDWWVKQASELHKSYGIEMFACDPSEPAYIEAFRNAGLPAIEAFNDIAPGVQAVRQRLAMQEDERARLYFVPSPLDEQDDALTSAKKPTSLIDEMDSYSWPKTSEGKSNKEVPEDRDNHGQDAARYAVAAVDLDAAPTPVSSPIVFAGGPFARRF